VQLGGYWEADYQVRFPASWQYVNETRTETPRKPKGSGFNAARGLLHANVQ